MPPLLPLRTLTGTFRCKSFQINNVHSEGIEAPMDHFDPVS
jgi:hypothetical protein